MEDIEKYPKDLSGIIASAYDWIWNSGFNFDITESISFFLHTKKYEQFEKYLKPQTLLVVEFKAKKFQIYEEFFTKNFEILDQRIYGISLFGFFKIK